ncbi:MAG: hypothetical protein V8R61_11220 [Enterocloster sp.]
MCVNGRIHSGLLERAVAVDTAEQMGIRIEDLQKTAAEADSREKLMVSIYRLDLKPFSGDLI